MHLLLILALLALALVGGWLPGLLLALASATTVDVGPLLSDMLTLAVTGLVGLVGWGVKLACARLHVDAQGAMAKAVEGGLDNGITWAAHVMELKLDKGPFTLDVKNEMAARAASYVLSHYKDWVKALGIDYGHLVQTALAKLPL